MSHVVDFLLVLQEFSNLASPGCNPPISERGFPFQESSQAFVLS